MSSPRQYLALLRQMGPGWLLYRAGYALRRRFGQLRRASPAMAWEQVPAPELRLHLRAKFDVSDSWGRACVDEAEAMLKGEFRLFSHSMVNAGFPPDWHRNQMVEDPPSPGFGAASGGRRAEGERQMSDVRRRSSELHWSEISDFGGGDIKGVWELSRFPWAFALTRAFARTKDERYPAAFWRLFDDWCRCNPPNQGPNWMCGQEATFRLMAVIFAAERLGVPVEQRELLARFVVATGRRINANLDYALSQKNNHGVSECVGLITTALLLPEHGQSAGWLSRGLRELREQLAELVYEDGGFSQHSLIYHRVLLHDLCWCRHRLEMAGQGSPAWLDAAGKRTLVFLMTVTDPVTGQVPLYGSNDGANVLPLAEAGFLDMRPVIQMAAAVFRDELLLPPGPWDEAAAWLKSEWNTLPRVPWPPPPPRWHASVSGCFQLAEGRDRLFLRCPTRFRHRPGHADMLHVDIWRDGRPIAMDGGSFSYNSPERFTVLSMAAQHNVLTVDGTEPMSKFSRFLYLPWPLGEARESKNDIFQAGHDGYARLGIQWRREVSWRSDRSGFIVRDQVRGSAGHKLRWHWRLADAPWALDQSRGQVETPNYRVSWTGPANARSSLLRADEATARGWWSPYYGSVEPAVSLLIEMEASGDVELVTEFSPLVD